MTVTLYSWTPPTTHSSKYLLRPTILNGPRDTILQDIDDWYSQDIEKDGFLERLDRPVQADETEEIEHGVKDRDRFDRSAESVRFP